MDERFELNNIPGANITWVPDLLYTNGRFESGRALACDFAGRVIAPLRMDWREIPEGSVRNVVDPERGLVFATRFVRLKGRALLPGMVNAHSHAFQRVIRGRTEHRHTAAASDSFWTWREAMYSAAARLTPEDIYDASRMAFVEMALSGITSVGEFHYLHRTPEGTEYDDPNLLAKEVVRAARDAGIRIALLGVAYARSGFNQPPNERQRRFIEPEAAKFIRHAGDLSDDLARGEREGGGQVGAAAHSWAGVAPHSVRAVPLEYTRAVAEFAAARAMPLHMHVAEQPAEVAACVEETGLTPVALLAAHGILGPRFTGVHAVHVTPEECDALAASHSIVCACPTTERNLGDGVVPADEMFARGISVALGTDSHAQIDLLEDARELEYHLRLQKLERNVLAPRDERRAGDSEMNRESDADGALLSSLASRLFECATAHGARSIGADAGELAPGRAADFFTVDLQDPSIAGASAADLLPSIVFSLSRPAVREVAVGGELIVEDGRHRAQDEVVARFAALQKNLWS